MKNPMFRVEEQDLDNAIYAVEVSYSYASACLLSKSARRCFDYFPEQHLCTRTDTMEIGESEWLMDETGRNLRHLFDRGSYDIIRSLLPVSVELVERLTL